MSENAKKVEVAVIVAHPDDEALWAGGMILKHPEWNWFIISLCRANDKERAEKFHKALDRYGAQGEICDIEDSPELAPLPPLKIYNTIKNTLPPKEYDLVITHSPAGEYTRHIRHEETAKGVLHLWENKKIKTKTLWTFAYEDGGGKYLPQADVEADLTVPLPSDIWAQKHHIITDVYGFSEQSFEAKTTPKTEAFRCYRSAKECFNFLS